VQRPRKQISASAAGCCDGEFPAIPDEKLPFEKVLFMYNWRRLFAMCGTLVMSTNSRNVPSLSLAEILVFFHG